MSALPQPKISVAERQERQEAVDFARHSVHLEGLKLSDEVEALNQRYINGEIGDAEHSESIRKLYGV